MTRLISVFAVLAFCAVACGAEKTTTTDDRPAKADEPKSDAADKGADTKTKSPKAEDPDSKPGRTLLITQSEFAPNDEGKYTVPNAAALLLVKKVDGKWTMDRIEDKESNVYHKALQYGEGILTIGANKAMLKLWTQKDGKWTSRVLWNPTFGGTHNRLRDFEMADFDGDGNQDLAIATHDQGVVAVLWNKDGEWKAEELDRKADTFVHEIEIGDLDGDGKLEIYSTPSQPNTTSGHGQGGAVTRYAWNGEKFEKSDVVVFEDRHVKEILVADVEGDNKPELYAVLEAQMGEKGTIENPVEIRRFDWKDGKFVSSPVTEIQDRFCRFLVAGDVDGDGKTELVAASFTAGVWVIEKDGDTWTSTNIDKKSGGFEHSAFIADMDGNNKQELYVADDRAGVLRRYMYVDGKYETKVINKRLVPAQAMIWNITVADL